MSVVRTDKWLNWYLQDQTNHRSKKKRMKSQKEFFVKPLEKWFDESFLKFLHPFLLDQGLFSPDEESLDELQKLADLSVWHDVQQVFVEIKEQWNGPDIPIYLLPAHSGMVDPAKKAGVSFPFAIFLFIGPHLKKVEIEALLIHEYHHSVRLQQTGLTEETIPFLESMYMEGLAECAVLERLGKEQLAYWTSIHQDQWEEKWVEKWIEPNLDLKGRSNHRKYLYGDARLRIPPMLGYYFGYQLAVACMNSRPGWNTVDWLRFTGAECDLLLKEVLKSMDNVE
ncbi:DUF2268 domain-containing putative Zn-dependent protease [Alkalicoccobacillus murimartini]|uniref:Uncharacterized protein YjaZ n=1 Tax=Alkalicoccobacillus murimartini TaxID=171685 RepID=A0ABT9YJ63_9BACI|nr:DUF2268 domain-containing putative Zn-dependent protease [Alkalicoccobacillus murimartini]MDQ0207905.1 uncharacterized protein YjaZ [Alkalicoccobacillus murimartini]